MICLDDLIHLLDFEEEHLNGWFLVLIMCYHVALCQFKSWRHTIHFGKGLSWLEPIMRHRVMSKWVVGLLLVILGNAEFQPKAVYVQCTEVQYSWHSEKPPQRWVRLTQIREKLLHLPAYSIVWTADMPGVFCSSLYTGEITSSDKTENMFTLVCPIYMK